jgi:hypothetical protein
MKAAESSTGQAIPRQEPRHFAAGYLLAMVIGATGLIVFVGLVLVALSSLGHLPPPQFANSLCIDEKLRFLRESPVLAAPGYQPDVLIAGSSVSWRHFDGEAVEQATGGRAKAFNGAFCGLTMSETVFATRYFLARYPSVREVVTIMAPQDLTKCSAKRPQIFQPEDVDRYVYGDGWAFPFYLKYFDPYTFVKNVVRKASNTVFRWGPAFDRFAALPIATDEPQSRLVYGPLDAYDPACFEALGALADELEASGRRLIVAAMPMHPAWLDRYDPERRRMRELEAGLAQALAGSRAVLWHPRTFALRADDFVDAIHIRWSAAKAFSYALVQETGLGQMAVAHRAPGDASSDTRLRQAN